MAEKIKLTGGPEKTVTWIWLESGQLHVEYYDFSEDAQRFFGNDIAYTLTVKEMDQLISAAKRNETSLMDWLGKDFKSYLGIKQWLEEQGIGFTVEIESHA